MEKETEYQILFSVKKKILEIVLTGEATKHTAEKILNEVIAIINVNGIENLLMDVRAIEKRFRYAQVYFRIRHLLHDRPKEKIAIVDLAKNAKRLFFLKILAKKAGVSFKGFTDIDEARAWLNSKEKKK
jgi:hypothetical protein